MAFYDVTTGPRGARYIDAADLPGTITADSGLMLASLAGNGKRLEDLLGVEKAFGRVNSTQDIRGAGGTALDFSAMTGAAGISAGTFGAGGYTTTQTGLFRVRVQVAYTTTNVAYQSRLQLTVNTTATPAVGAWPAGTDEGSAVVEDILALDAGDVVGALNTQVTGDGSAVNLIANASTFYIERLDA